MVQARDRAGQTPDEVRGAFLAQRTMVCGVELKPFTLGILWLLEELGSPLMDPAQQGVNLNLRDTARAIYVFKEPQAARAALTEGVAVLDEQAHALALNFTPGDVRELCAAITNIVTEGLATVPGAGGGNPPGAPG